MAFPAEHFETANVIAVFMGQKHAIELVRRNSALSETKNQLARAQSTIDEEPAMIGRDEGAISCAAAAEHRETEHRPISNGRDSLSQIRNAPPVKKGPDLWVKCCHPETRRPRGTSHPGQITSMLSIGFARRRRGAMDRSREQDPVVIRTMNLRWRGPSPSARLGMTPSRGSISF